MRPAERLAANDGTGELGIHGDVWRRCEGAHECAAWERVPDSDGGLARRELRAQRYCHRHGGLWEGYLCGLIVRRIDEAMGCPMRMQVRPGEEVVGAR